MARTQPQSNPAHGDVAQARRTFFDFGGAPVGQVPNAILQSWRRCRSLGLAADRRPPIEPVDALRLRDMRERHEQLWRLARAEVEMLASDAALDEQRQMMGLPSGQRDSVSEQIDNSLLAGIKSQFTRQGAQAGFVYYATQPSRTVDPIGDRVGFDSLQNKGKPQGW